MHRHLYPVSCWCFHCISTTERWNNSTSTRQFVISAVVCVKYFSSEVTLLIRSSQWSSFAFGFPNVCRVLIFVSSKCTSVCVECYAYLMVEAHTSRCVSPRRLWICGFWQSSLSSESRDCAEGRWSAGSDGQGKSRTSDVTIYHYLFLEVKSSANGRKKKITPDILIVIVKEWMIHYLLGCAVLC